MTVVCLKREDYSFSSWHLLVILNIASEHCFEDAIVQLATLEKEEGIYIPLLVARQFNGIVSTANQADISLGLQ